MDIKQMILATSMLALPAASALASDSKAYCLQMRPQAAKGYIVEEMVLSSPAGKATVDVSTLGIGILGPQGDGTASDGYLKLAHSVITEDSALKATSAEWRQAIPFALSLQNGAKAILYIKPEAFSGAAEFQARIKEIDGAGRETKSSILSCNQI